MAQTNSAVLGGITKYSDILMALGVIGVLIIMIIPVPTPLLDMLLTFNITVAVIILFIGIYILNPPDFSIFPGLLLITTLLRLSLNIASARLILLHGHEGATAAGEVIKAFGSFVVGGNYVVGVIIFAILVIINFVVITKGSGRIAEVAARFTLDAMPGKQMAIDADLNAGLITESEAKVRRQKISKEADFYGAMDGASKFVRGDAIAAVIITVVNIVGGLIIGVFQEGMPIGTAAQTYTLLTIGDGLVSQIPALVISTAAGIIVTRAASEANLGAELVGQILAHHRALGLAAGVIFFFGLIPGMPTIPFFAMGIVTGYVTYLIYRSRREAMVEAVEERAETPEEKVEKVEALLPLDVLELEVGYNLIPLVDVEQDGSLLDRVKSIRRQFALDMGLVVPPMHIRDNLQLGPNEYSILIKGVEIAKGDIMPDHYLAMDSGETEMKIEGIPTKEPAFGLPSLWIEEKDKERAQIAGYTVVDTATVIATHISEVIKKNAFEFLGRQEVQKLLEHLAESYPKAVEELVPNVMSVGGVQKVLQSLVKEGVSVRNFLSIVETLGDHAPTTRNVDLLTDYVRQALARQITRQHLLPDGSLHIMTLDKTIEDMITRSLQHTETESYLTLEPAKAHQIINTLTAATEKFREAGLTPIILTSPIVRTPLKRLTERFIPTLVVLSHNEISADASITNLGMVSLSHGN
ncbi:MAG: flagellar biosynthesis protein FlhA [Deltaproteobacteria bacterium]|nr:flagellar biosynthesis protein FlhA [Deltaproteobacteria bacterium]MBF0526087.1 flagellar biosynthesis protein FlhA [Deltaproteobacteria bacterium]